jgi:hypothetical protein
MSDNATVGTPSPRASTPTPTQNPLRPPMKREGREAAVNISFAPARGQDIATQGEGTPSLSPANPSRRHLSSVVLRHLSEGVRAIAASIAGIIILSIIFTALVNDMTLLQAIDLLAGGLL